MSQRSPLLVLVQGFPRRHKYLRVVTNRCKCRELPYPYHTLRLSERTSSHLSFCLGIGEVQVSPRCQGHGIGLPLSTPCLRAAAWFIAVCRSLLPAHEGMTTPMHSAGRVSVASPLCRLHRPMMHVRSVMLPPRARVWTSCRSSHLSLHLGHAQMGPCSLRTVPQIGARSTICFLRFSDITGSALC